jgi:hypothetical protein
MWNAQGDPIKGEISSSDAHSGIVATLYKSGSASAYTLAANERITITDVLFVSTGGGAYSLSFRPITGGSLAGTRIIAGATDAYGGIVHHFETPISGPAGVPPMLVADAGTVNLIITGYITKT